MPCLEIVIPEIDQEKKVKLAENLTEAFSSSTKFPADIFRDTLYGIQAGGISQRRRNLGW